MRGVKNRLIWLGLILLGGFYAPLYGLGSIAIESDESYDYHRRISALF